MHLLHRTDQRLVASHHVVLDPAYVHITQASLAETARVKAALAADDIHSVGRYGGWTYCSIEDNLIETGADDFVFSYSTHNQSPDSRASHYVNNYGTDNGAGDYIGTWFMWELADAKGFSDPRSRYYLYRQLDNVTNDPRVASERIKTSG